jgi:hypothetical protein
MRQLHYFIMLLGVTLLLSTRTCFAFDPNGVWASSSGSSVQVWANMQQVSVTLTSPQGQTSQFNGWWTQFGDYFSYQSPDGVMNAAFNGSNQINVQGPNGLIYTWNRGQQSAPAPRPNNAGINISGLWSSSSGSSVQLSTKGNQVFITLIDKQGKRNQGSGRWLEAGRRFDYSFPNTAVAYCTIINQNQIDVVNGQTANSWFRQ